MYIFLKNFKIESTKYFNLKKKITEKKLYSTKYM